VAKLACQPDGRFQSIVRLRSRRLTSGWVQPPAVRAARSVGPNIYSTALFRIVIEILLGCKHFAGILQFSIFIEVAWVQ